MLFRFYHNGTRLTVDAPSETEARKRAARIRRDFAGKLGHDATRPARGITKKARRPILRIEHQGNPRFELDALNAFDAGFMARGRKLKSREYRAALNSWPRHARLAFQLGVVG